VEHHVKIRLRDLSFFYGERRILDKVCADFYANALTAIVGPSGQGKSSLLTVINRLWEEIPGARADGQAIIRLAGQQIAVSGNGNSWPPERLRRKVGMVFQEPNPLPMSVFKNVAFPLRLCGGHKKTAAVDAKVRQALSRAYLWEEVKDRLDADARSLSGGQQQRLCIARALVLEPEVLLLDEPTASLDARASLVIENLLTSLKSRCTLLVVSHYMEQVRRVADSVVELVDGRLAPLRW
jgi:phosphate transport system ATP-binding protein